jgi:hypothetical protein
MKRTEKSQQQQQTTKKQTKNTVEANNQVNSRVLLPPFLYFYI